MKSSLNLDIMNNLKTLPLFSSKFISRPCFYMTYKFNSNGKRYETTGVAFTLNLFNIKLKKHNWPKKEVVEVNKNFAGKPKHFPPSHTEWFNSIYAYNKNTSKLLPVALKVTHRLLKSYFNIYSRNLEKIKGSRRLFLKARRLSTNRILISKPELKHTNDKVIFLIYVYNRQKKYILNKIKKIASLDNMDNLLPNKIKKKLKKSGSWPSNSKMKIIRKNTLKIRSKVNKHEKIALKMINKNKTKPDRNKFSSELSYLKNYVSKCLRKEILSLYLRQLILFNKSKFQEKYLLPLTSLVKKVYNKEIEFHVVNLKYLYLNSHIFSETLVTKLRNRKNRLLNVLKTSLSMFKLSPMDRTAVYNEIYNRKRILQNPQVENVNFDISLLNRENEKQSEIKDILGFSLEKRELTNLLKNKETVENNPFYYPFYTINTVLKLIKHKYVSGIRIEVAGRLSKRNTANRSVFKLNYKGNIKNMDSSYKGLPSVLSRGYAKSNLQYSNLKSRVRIGSFGLKGWVSSS